MKRRIFLKSTTFAAGGLFLGLGKLSQLLSCRKNDMMMMSGNNLIDVIEGSFTEHLSFPSTITNTNLELTSQETNFLIAGKNNLVLGYQSNSILGPTIKLNNGSNLSIILNNHLLESTNVHWHGLKVPVNVDGYPTDMVNSGSSVTYNFTLNQRAGMYWYHPHPMSLTAKQAYRGLAGLFIVNDTEESALQLPSGNYEIPLVIQDKRLTLSNLAYAPSSSEIMSGYTGESILVNGIASPYYNVETSTYRLRLLNGSNARIYNIAFSNNLSFHVIGSDGGLLRSAEEVNELLLSPGERVDLIVDFSSINIGTEIFLISKPFTNSGTQGNQSFKMLKLKINSLGNYAYSIPSTLSNIAALNTSRTRNFVLSEMQMSSGGSMSGMHQINGKTFDANRIDETVNANTTELWTFENQGTEPHPMHLHGVQFQVLSRTGGNNRGLLASEKGWKDTVLVLPNETVKIAVPFGNLLGKYVFHCHNLEHEDDGMMLQYKLI